RNGVSDVETFGRPSVVWVPVSPVFVMTSTLRMPRTAALGDSRQVVAASLYGVEDDRRSTRRAPPCAASRVPPASAGAGDCGARGVVLGADLGRRARSDIASADRRLSGAEPRGAA